MDFENHYLLKFAEDKISTCPHCEEEGKYSEISWDLHPEDSNSQQIGDRVFGRCYNGHEVFCSARVYTYLLGEVDKERYIDIFGTMK